MAESIYAKNIITKWPFPVYQRKEGRPELNLFLGVSDEIIKGAFTVHCAWINPGPNPGDFSIHVHPHDELIGFCGTNPDDPLDLGAEAEFWMDGEKHLIKNSFIVFIPKGVKHCPLVINDVKRPIFHLLIATTEKYKAFWGVEKLPE
jgi:hypothetical protein